MILCVNENTTSHIVCLQWTSIGQGYCDNQFRCREGGRRWRLPLLSINTTFGLFLGNSRVPLVAPFLYPLSHTFCFKFWQSICPFVIHIYDPRDVHLPLPPEGSDPHVRCNYIISISSAFRPSLRRPDSLLQKGNLVPVNSPSTQNLSGGSFN